MFRYIKDGVSLLMIIDQRRAKKSGLFPIKIQIVHKRRQRYWSTGKDISPQDWERMISNRSTRMRELYQDLDELFDRFRGYIQEITRKGEFNFRALDQIMGRGDTKSLNDLFGSRIAELTANEQIGNMIWYRNVLRSIERYTPEPIPIIRVNIEWLSQYEHYMIKDKKSFATISMHLRAVRAIMNLALNRGLIRENDYPFGHGKFEIQSYNGRKKALTIKQIEEISKYKCSKANERYRDMWLFIYLCNGINVADMIRLKFKNIQSGELFFIRQKTARTSKTIKEICVTVTPEMEHIIKQWGNKPHPDSYIFSILKGNESAMEIKVRTQSITRSINRAMHAIGEELGLGVISTYTARHSFATVLKRSGAPISYISESLGHSDLKTTEHYLANFEKEERIKNAGLLTDF